MIINAGIKRIIYAQGYAEDTVTGKLMMDMLKEAGIELVRYEKKDDK
jgi:deoxycytidylate deaminase